ncbi:pilus assembly protein [Piscinibacter sakaiensis]|uniref:pilus assembly protein n=1 Tax=Piscinibacter sakaiensis TaxID=1547922 RepID=UPI003AABD631
MPNFSTSFSAHSVPRSALAVLLLIVAGQSVAQLTDIAAEPVINRQTVSAKPNLMFILDDSGSMARAYMPDEMSATGSYGYLSAQCNGVAFDPSLPYTPPVYANGASYPNASFTNAKDDGYSATSTSRNLGGQTYYVYTGTQPKMGWTYDSSGNEITSSTFYKECTSTIGNSPGNTKFIAVTVNAGSPDAQKYANWWSYYRTRMLMMRTSVGLAVNNLDDKYRVGFSRINSTTVTDGIDFRDTKAFDATQRTNFYASLYAAPPSGGTPLRGALSKVGRYFAKKITGQSYDPVEYECQRNYALLSTDGYWNSGGGTVAENSTYGPYGLDGNAVGNQDVTEVRPMYDGGDSIKTEKTPITTITRRQVATTDKVTTTSKRNLIEIDTVGCGKDRFNEWTTPETRVVVTNTQTPSVVRDTATKTRTIVTTNGTVTSDTTSTTTTTTSTESTGSPVSQPGSDTGWTKGTRAKTQSCKKASDVQPAGYGPVTNTTQNSSSQSSTVLSVEGPTDGQTTTSFSSSGGTSDTLADVAQYFYATDLRTPALGNCTSSTSGQSRDVCANKVPAAGRDTNTAQHLTTFTLGLGTGGTIGFDKNYLQQTSLLRCDNKLAPPATGCEFALLSGHYRKPDGSGPVLNWPATTTVLSGSSGDARNIDDLWHAAVNGRGQYYSASDANALSEAISSVINTIKEVTGAGAAASFNSLTFVPGLANQVFQAGYTAFAWTGDLLAYSVKGEDGVLGSSPLWSAKEKLDAMAWTNRKIYYRQPSGTALRSFTYANLNADGLGGNFSNFCSKVPMPAQCANFSPPNQALKTAADDGINLVNYLAGDRTNNTNNPASPLFRARASVLGDIIHGAPVFVGKPPFIYTDAGYASYASSRANREPMVYAGGNDGMLHAFSAKTGVEMWAFIPTVGMSKMFRLADTAYGNNHQSFVDAEPVVGDAFFGGSWKTILVGGLGLGGKAYYALDITDPLDPKALWEFTDPNLGLTYGNPIITKRANGSWVVVFASGYNNADGKGHLYVVDIATGAKLLDIVTPAGSPGTPSGLAKINAWIDVSTNNTAKRFYGGDMLGNLWRFDIDDLVLPYKSAQLLGQLQTPTGAPQPVTVKPEVMLVSKLYPVVVVGTGRYLGDTDITDSKQQSVYIVKDTLTNSGHGVVRTNPSLVKHTLTRTGSSVTSSTEPIDWNVNNGWWFDLPNSGERIVSGMSLSSGTLFIPSAVPSGDACTSGGSSWLYRIDITSGLSMDPIGMLFSTDSLIVGQTFARLSGGGGRMYVRNSKGETKQFDTGESTPAGTGDPRRTSWRELIN